MTKCLPIAMAAGLAVCPLAISSASGAVPEPSPVAAATPPAPSARNRPDSDKPICKSQPIMGSRLRGKEICLTREQWDEHSRIARDALRGMADSQPYSGPMVSMTSH